MQATTKLLLLTAILLATPMMAMAQDGGGSTLHYMGAGLGAGIATVGAGKDVSNGCTSGTEKDRAPQRGATHENGTGLQSAPGPPRGG